MKLHEESHLDHGLTPAQVDYLLDLFADRREFFIETVKLPSNLGMVPCGLYGPEMGDEPVPDDDCIHACRGGRDYLSRLTDRPVRHVFEVTVIAGPHDGEPCIVYTAFGGPLAPKEVDDPTLQDHERERSEAFWAEHALSTDND